MSKVTLSHKLTLLEYQWKRQLELNLHSLGIPYRLQDAKPVPKQEKGYTCGEERDYNSAKCY